MNAIVAESALRILLHRRNCSDLAVRVSIRETIHLTIRMIRKTVNG